MTIYDIIDRELERTTGGHAYRIESRVCGVGGPSWHQELGEITDPAALLVTLSDTPDWDGCRQTAPKFALAMTLD